MADVDGGIICRVAGCDCRKRFGSMAELSRHLVGDKPEKKHRARVRGVKAAADRTWAGVCYASQMEMRRAMQLDADPDVLLWLYQPKLYRLGMDGFTYRPDFFVLMLMDGRRFCWFEDVKGMESDRFKIIRTAWKNDGPANLHILKSAGKNKWNREILTGGKVSPGLLDERDIHEID